MNGIKDATETILFSTSVSRQTADVVVGGGHKDP